MAHVRHVPDLGSFEEHTLEEVVHQMHAAGIVYADKKTELDRLELFKPSVKALVMQEALDKAGETKISEVRLAHLAEASSEYIDHLHKLVRARGEYERARVDYEALKNLFEAKRSQLSYEKAEMSLI